MPLNYKNIQLLIAHKEQELKTLKDEWREASYIPEDTDYEYLSVLYPIIAETERELARFRKLAANEYVGEPHFPRYIRQLSRGECQRLETHIELRIGQCLYFKGPIMVFDKMKQKYAVTARLLQYDWLDGYLHNGSIAQLYKLGWKRQGKKAFMLKHLVRDEEDLMQLYRQIACTFMEPLSYLMRDAKEQQFVIIPSPDN